MGTKWKNEVNEIMEDIMKKFNVTVNGKTYAVEVEEVGAGQGGFTYQPAPAAPQTPVQQAPAAPQPQAPAAPVAAPAPKASSGPVDGETLSAPMPGTILDIRVSEGQNVKAGEILLILEAMKMENEIVSPKDGVVNRIHTSKSSTVSTGDALVTIG
jgi:biotin carboxyl carrier protein